MPSDELTELDLWLNQRMKINSEQSKRQIKKMFSDLQKQNAELKETIATLNKVYVLDNDTIRKRDLEIIKLTSKLSQAEQEINELKRENSRLRRTSNKRLFLLRKRKQIFSRLRGE